ncbi:hypothetical protein HOK51_04345 [Candidatus Woesearchaeota archaeon]|nr:hypothetical protein [Candidatus Woesearchaeota archaeon]MBT6519053.1 hypothetical protein [Candidatus Woesearchaeota archaeon]MBT7367322.1 hypothetical protein [Candidatus Woesearchaeota archaeon]
MGNKKRKKQRQRSGQKTNRAVGNLQRVSSGVYVELDTRRDSNNIESDNSEIPIQVEDDLSSIDFNKIKKPEEVDAAWKEMAEAEAKEKLRLCRPRVPVQQTERTFVQKVFDSAGEIIEETTRTLLGISGRSSSGDTITTRLATNSGNNNRGNNNRGSNNSGNNKHNNALKQPTQYTYPGNPNLRKIRDETGKERYVTIPVGDSDEGINRAMKEGVKPVSKPKIILPTPVLRKKQSENGRKQSGKNSSIKVTDKRHSSQSVIKEPELQNAVWEWRTFQEVDAVTAKKLLELPDYKSMQVIDSYLMYSNSRHYNIKLRDGKLKLKKYIKSEGSYELWTDHEFSFPIVQSVLQKIIRGTGMPAIPNASSLESFLTTIHKSPQINLVDVHKQRIMKQYKGCGIDINLLYIDEVVNQRGLGEYVEQFDNQVGIIKSKEPEIIRREYVSVGVESSKKENLVEVVNELGLLKYDQKSYFNFLNRLNFV